MRVVRRTRTVLLLSAALASCSSSTADVVLPAPGPTSLYIPGGHATFTLVGIVESGGLRGNSGTDIQIAADGYPDAGGQILLAQVVSLKTSAPCAPTGRGTILSFAPRWRNKKRLPFANELTLIPTRFALPQGPATDSALNGKRIRALGIIPLSATRCDTLTVQYVEVEA